MKFYLGTLFGFVVLVSLGLARQESVLATEFATSLTKATGIRVYVDPRLDDERVTLKGEQSITAGNFEDHMKRFMKALPPGADWAKLHLPPPPAGKEWRAVDVFAYARAHAQLYGTVGATEADTVEILSQKLPPDKAKGVVEVLNLKPVYIVLAGRGSCTGRWNTTYGEMRLVVTRGRVTGTYTSGMGKIEGTLTGDIMRFRWIEGASGGPGVFMLSEDGDSFSGRWGYDDIDQEPGPWTGTRISRTP